MKNYKNELFSSYVLGDVVLKNRYAMVAMGTGGMVTKENTFNERGVEYYVERAKGGVGLIITGTLYVENEIEVVAPGVMPCPTDSPAAFIMTSSEMCERVHAYDTKIFAQLTAGFGRVIKPHLLKKQPVSASEMPHFWDPNLMCRELTVEEIQTIVRKTGETAKICKQAGFDGVEIHAVHEGYLLDQFAMSLFNKRTDEYGGDLRGRLKFACDIVKSIKEQCGESFPVLMRYGIKSYIKGFHQGGLPNEDFIELGRDIEEGIEAAKILQEAGYDGIDVDAGAYDSWYWAHPPMYFEHGMNRSFGKLLKDNIDIPVIVAGRMDNPDIAAESLLNGETDLIGLGRSLLADSQTVNKIKQNEFSTVRPCLSCHEGCMQRLTTARPLSCAVNPVCGRETTYGLTPTDAPKKIAIIGAGPAGMEAARVLATRGHNPTIFEKNNRVGGALLIASVPSFKHDDVRLINWYSGELARLGVPINLNCSAEEAISWDEWDIIIVATGSEPIKLNLDKSASQIHLAEDVLMNKHIVGDNPIIIGGGLVGCELALHLSEMGKNVTIVEAAKDILSGKAATPHMNRTMLCDLLKFNKVEIIVDAKVIETDIGKLKYKFSDGSLGEISGSDLISAIGYRSDDKLYNNISEYHANIYKIGDCKEVCNIMNAIWSAYELARSL